MITLKNITKEFRQKEEVVLALNDVNLSFEKNQLVGIMGVSGSGKTTLFNIIYGFENNFEGELNQTVNKEDIHYITQKNVLLKDKLVIDQFLVANKTATLDQIKSSLVEAGLDESFIYRKTKYLSAGEEKRLMIAIALIKNAKVILADEPTENLDKNNQIQIMNLLKELSKSKLVIVISHQEAVLSEYADRLIKMEKGCVVEDKLIEPVLKQEVIKNETDSNIIPRTIDRGVFLKSVSFVLMLMIFISSFSLLLSAFTRLTIKDKESFQTYHESVYQLNNPTTTYKDYILNNKVSPVYNMLLTFKGIFYSELDQYAELSVIYEHKIHTLNANLVKNNYIYGKKPTEVNEVSIGKTLAKLLIEKNNLSITIKMSDLIGKRVELNYGQVPHTFYIAGIYDSNDYGIAVNEQFYVRSTPYYNKTYAVSKNLISENTSLLNNQIIVSEESEYTIGQMVEIEGITFEVIATYEDNLLLNKIIMADSALNLINYELHKESTNLFLVLDETILKSQDIKLFNSAYSSYLGNNLMGFLLLIIFSLLITVISYFVLFIINIYQLTYFESNILFYKLNHYSNYEIFKAVLKEKLAVLIATSIITSILIKVIINATNNALLFSSTPFFIVSSIIAFALVILNYISVLSIKVNKSALKMYRNE